MKAAKWAGLSELLIRRLESRKPEFHSHRSLGSVRIDMDGTTVGTIDIAQASANVGLSFQSRNSWSGQMLTTSFSKDDQCERKKTAYVCAFLGVLLDDRPSEERRKNRMGGPLNDPKLWFSKMGTGHVGESEAYRLRQDLTGACATLSSVFLDLDEALKSARGEDVAEAVNRVKKDLPFLTGKLSEEEWMRLYHEAVVDQVHDL